MAASKVELAAGLGPEIELAHWRVAHYYQTDLRDCSDGVDSRLLADSYSELV